MDSFRSEVIEEAYFKSDLRILPPPGAVNLEHVPLVACLHQVDIVGVRAEEPHLSHHGQVEARGYPLGNRGDGNGQHRPSIGGSIATRRVAGRRGQKISRALEMTSAR